MKNSVAYNKKKRVYFSNHMFEIYCISMEKELVDVM